MNERRKHTRIQTNIHTCNICIVKSKYANWKFQQNKTEKSKENITYIQSCIPL